AIIFRGGVEDRRRIEMVKDLFEALPLIVEAPIIVILAFLVLDFKRVFFDRRWWLREGLLDDRGRFRLHLDRGHPGHQRRSKKTPLKSSTSWRWVGRRAAGPTI
ncbi:MAG: hypothetical protein P8Z40_14630, partial [Chloroflexota bacterium]